MARAVRCLVVTYGGGHANIVGPVVRELSARPGWEAVVLAATSAGPQLRAAGIPTVAYRDLVVDGDTAALAHGRRLLPRDHDPATGIPADESVAYLGLCYQDLVERLGSAEASDRYERHGRHAFLPLGPLRRALDRWHPDVVVTTNSPKSERAALVVAAERGIPSLALEDCLGMRLRILPEFVPAFRADRVCACTSIAIEHLAAQGTDPASVRVTGNPAFDPIARIGAAETGSVRRTVGLSPDRRAVLFATQASTDLVALARAVRRLVEAVPDLDVVLRRHPTRRTVDPTPVIEAARGRVRLAEDVPVQPLIGAVDALATVSSTTALEAILLGVPVIQLGAEMGITAEHGEGAGDLPLYAHGAAILVRTDDELARTVHECVHGGLGAELRSRTRELFAPPGHAAERVADEIGAIAT